MPIEREMWRDSYYQRERQQRLTFNQRLEERLTQAGIEEASTWARRLDNTLGRAIVDGEVNMEAFATLAEAIPDWTMARDLFMSYTVTGVLRRVGELVADKSQEEREVIKKELAMAAELLAEGRWFNDAFRLVTRIWACPAVLDYFGGDRQRAVQFVATVDDYWTWDSVESRVRAMVELDMPVDREKFLAIEKWGGIEKVLKSATKEGLEELMMCSDKRWLEASLDYVVGFSPWEKRLANMATILTEEKVGDVDNKGLDREILLVHARRVVASRLQDKGLSVEMGEDYKEEWAKVVAEINSLPAGKRFLLVVGLRKEYREEGLEEMREKIRGAKGPEVFDGRALARVRRRESELNPLVSLGITRKAGYEIEFPNLTDRDDNTDKLQRVMRILELVGFKHDYDGNNCDEIAPGPFYDPRTAIMIYEAYVRMGMIDFYQYRDFGVQLNLGLSRKEGLDKLVWGLRLSGAFYSPLRKERYRDGFELAKHVRSEGSYYEIRTMDIPTEASFSWGYEAGVCLSWALGAYQDIAREFKVKRLTEEKIVGSKQNEYKKELARIWMNYSTQLTGGLRFLGWRGIRGEYPNSDQLREVNKEIALVYPDLEARFADPRQVTEGKDPEWYGATMETREVRVGNRLWANVVAFASEIVAEAATRVEELTDAVEADVVADIKRIEQASGRSQTQLIGNFVNKYVVKLAEGATWKEKREAYEEVKELFVDLLE